MMLDNVFVFDTFLFKSSCSSNISCSFNGDSISTYLIVLSANGGGGGGGDGGDGNGNGDGDGDGGGGGGNFIDCSIEISSTTLTSCLFLS